MSEKKGPFDDFIVAANETLISAEQFAGSMIPLLRATTKLGGISIAIRVLEEWPKWKPLIEAAGRVDKVKLHLRCGSLIRLTPELDALLESLPEKEKERG